MYFKQKSKVLSLFVVLAMLMSLFASLPVMAANDIKVVLTNVTSSNATTLTGEAKIQVSIKGNPQNVTALQTALNFKGDLEYKSVDYLIEADAPAEVDPYNANASKKISVGFALNDAISFDEETPLFILTFEGDANDSVKLTCPKSQNMTKIQNITL